MFGDWIDERSQIRLITHVFDDDEDISTPKLRYTLTMIFKDCSEHNENLVDLHMSKKKISNTNYFILNETFTISEKVSQWRNIALMYVKFIQLSDESCGKELNLSLVVVHHANANMQ